MEKASAPWTPGKKSLDKPGREHWVEDTRADQCVACSVDFGVLVWKHHCRACGGIFCRHCSSRWVSYTPPARSKEEDYREKIKRVCEACFKNITEARGAVAGSDAAAKMGGGSAAPHGGLPQGQPPEEGGQTAVLERPNRARQTRRPRMRGFVKGVLRGRKEIAVDDVPPAPPAAPPPGQSQKPVTEQVAARLDRAGFDRPADAECARWRPAQACGPSLSLACPTLPTQAA
mmetsp:Transcript_14513/g.41407  ORF Transcript_14513/g.41407 Transcript_14513/m.41407 type:complete len:231 (-) Transcript_14513:131-823(-)